MIDKEKINLLYERLINQKLTKNDLNNLYIFGTELFNIHEYSKAQKIYLKCLEIDNNHYDTLFQLFLLNIKNCDYQIAINYLVKLYNLNDKSIENNLNLYLYILNLITILPDNLLDKVSTFTLNNLLIKDNKDLNNIRTLIYYGEFHNASHSLVKMLKENKLNVNINLEYLLYKDACILIDKQTNYKLKLIKNHNYQDLKNLLLNQKNCLTEIDKEILKIINEPTINIENINFKNNKLIKKLLKEIVLEEHEEIIDKDLEKKLNFIIQNVYENGIDIIDNFNKKSIYNYIRKRNDISILELGHKAILKYSPYPSVHLNFDNLLKEGKLAYNNKDYYKSIKIFRKLLEQSSPNSFIYAQLGLAYMKVFNLEVAIQYLTVANLLNEDKKFDYSKLIESLKQSLNQEQAFDFKSELNEYYGLKNIEKVFEMLKKGDSIEIISQNLEFNEEEFNLVNLIIAREYYFIGNYLMGDNYLKKVLKANNKSLNVRNILEEIKQNKKFYKNREHLSLLLTKD